VKWVDPRPIRASDDLRQALPVPDTLSDLVAQLLVQRGITTPEQARRFIDPAHYTPKDPGELPDMSRAVHRLAQAIRRDEQIVIWGDFDVDGQTATALLLQALRALGARVKSAIPTRQQSHGLRPPAAQRLIDAGAQLIVTVDTGVDAHAAISLAHAHGVDVIVTDHHDPPEPLPEPLALVNPKLLPAEHALYELPGVGVAYQVVRALHEQIQAAPPDALLDLVALGIVADVANLRADVRYLLQRGLDALRQTARIGLQEMMSLADVTPALLTEDDIRFALAPRLNAASRVGQDRDERSAAEQVVELLTTDDQTLARTIATRLEALNARRRWMTRETTDAALALLESDRSLLDGPAIVVAAPNWDPGIVGIVAGQLASRFARPAIVISVPPGELARGSARSVKGIDIHAAIAAQRHLLHRCGGHPMAAGLSLEADRIDVFRRALWRTLEEMVPTVPEPVLQVDASVTLDQVDLDLVRAVRTLAPFGPGNDAPTLSARDVEVVSNAIIGRTREHRRLIVRDAQGREAPVFWWRSADLAAPESRFDLAFTVGLNTFRGESSAQLVWVAARAIEPVAVRPAPKARIDVFDCRSMEERVALAEVFARQAEGRVLVWSEGGIQTAVDTVDRTRLSKADALVVWTIPPGPGALCTALNAVLPRRVMLFDRDPGMDEPRTFLERLGGLVKYALRERGGRARLSALAAATAHETWTVRLGLQWMAEKGQLDVSFDRGGWASFRPARRPPGERLHVLEGQLQAQLEETAAYRAYYARADAERLVNG